MFVIILKSVVYSKPREFKLGDSVCCLGWHDFRVGRVSICIEREREREREINRLKEVRALGHCRSPLLPIHKTEWIKRCEQICLIEFVVVFEP
jgi:hypothetical protein